MKKIAIITLALATIGLNTISFIALSHSGNTDAKGGHNCSQKSKDKGLCTGYHYHNRKLVANDEVGHEGHAKLEVHTHQHTEVAKVAATEGS